MKAGCVAPCLFVFAKLTGRLLILLDRASISLAINAISEKLSGSVSKAVDHLISELTFKDKTAIVETEYDELANLNGLAEIKTLNGGITITDDGIDEAQKLGAGF